MHIPDTYSAVVMCKFISGYTARCKLKITVLKILEIFQENIRGANIN